MGFNHIAKFEAVRLSLSRAAILLEKLEGRLHQPTQCIFTAFQAKAQTSEILNKRIEYVRPRGWLRCWVCSWLRRVHIWRAQLLLRRLRVAVAVTADSRVLPSKCRPRRNASAFGSPRRPGSPEQLTASRRRRGIFYCMHATHMKTQCLC